MGYPSRPRPHRRGHKSAYTTAQASGGCAEDITIASYNKFYQFVEDLGKGVHQLHAAGHTLKVYLSNAAPSASADAVKTDMAEITNQNGYTAPVDIQNDLSRSSGTVSVTAVDVVITASGAVGPFQYVVIYNDTPTSPADPLICWFDYGSALTLASGETFTVDFGSSLFTLA